VGDRRGRCRHVGGAESRGACFGEEGRVGWIPLPVGESLERRRGGCTACGSPGRFGLRCASPSPCRAASGASSSFPPWRVPPAGTGWLSAVRAIHGAWRVGVARFHWPVLRHCPPTSGVYTPTQASVSTLLSCVF